MPGPHDFAVRFSAVRLRATTAHDESPCDSSSRADAAASTASHPNVRDDREPPLLRDEMATVVNVIWGNREAIYFSREGWTGIRERCPSGKSLDRKSARRACGTKIFFILP